MAGDVTKRITGLENMNKLALGSLWRDFFETAARLEQSYDVTKVSLRDIIFSQENVH